MSEKKDNRTRNWSFIIYPESAPENWKELLLKQMVKFAVSPLHNEDINEGTGEFKKPHYHIYLSFEGKKSYEQVKTMIEPLNGTIPQTVNSAKGLIRYFVHKDNPEKAQYSINDIYCFGDIDIVSPFKTSSSRYEAIKEMIQFIKSQNITEFQDLMDYAMMEEEEWFRYLCDNSAYIIQEYIKSARHRNLRGDLNEKKN